MAEPLRVLYLGESCADTVDAELQKGGYEPSLQCIQKLADLPAALDRGGDIAICDSVNGECGALAVLRIIQERGMDLPLIVVSVELEDAEVLGALSAGAADHMNQSDLTRLNAAVSRELRALRMRREQARMVDQFGQSQKMEALGRLAAGVAHDFNNLLTIITGYSDLLLTSRTLDQTQRTGLEEIRRAAERGGALTHQLLGFSRRRPVEVSVIPINQLLLRMERMMRRLIGENINLTTIPAASPDTVACDPGRIEQVILNLVVNARDAMPRSGILTIETGNAQVSKRTTEQLNLAPGRYVTLTVSDTGIGMDQKTLKHAFEPFFTTKSPGNGTGLGLATVYGAVREIGGVVDLSSEPGKGTRVQIYLPMVKEKGQVTRSRAAAKALAGSETILILEDDARVRKLIAGVLRGHGYTVLEATSPEEAVSLVKDRKGQIQLAVVDVVMPELSGPEVVQKLAPLAPDMRVLYISGYTDEAIVHHRIPESGEAFLQKPFLPEALAAKVREVLDPRGNSAP